MKRGLTIFFLLLLCSALWLLPIQGSSTEQKHKAMVITLSGAVGPAMSDYFQRSIDEAQQQNFAFVIVQLDTPGGLELSMLDMNKKILSATIPIVVYVSPSGARAASAGTYLLYASHIAAMAPGTHLGAASPINVMDEGLGSGESQKNKSKANTQNILEKKMTLDALAYLRSLAQLRGRNTEFAAQSIVTAATMTAVEAKQKKVIDILAVDMPDLLRQLDDHKINLQNKVYVFDTKNITLESKTMDWRMELLSVITDPNVAYILLLLGIYGLFFEFVNPGFVLPGVVGGIALLLALYALQMLPINYAGLGLIVLGISFMIAEAFIPFSGALGIGGVIAFIAGSILLLDTEFYSATIAWPLILAMALANALMFFVVMGMSIRAHQRKVITGSQAMLNKQGVALQEIDLKGQAKIEGEIWQVIAIQPIKKGEIIRVIEVEVEGLVLKVEAIRNC